MIISRWPFVPKSIEGGPGDSNLARVQTRREWKQPSPAAVEAQKAILVDLHKRETEGYALAAKNGMKIHEITPDEVAEWRVCSAPLIEAFMNNAGEQGQSLTEAYGKLRTQPCCTAGTPGVFTRR